MGPARISTLVGWHLSKTQRRLLNGQGRAHLEPRLGELSAYNWIGQLPRKEWQFLNQARPAVEPLMVRERREPASGIRCSELDPIRGTTGGRI